ncbi:MAG TPA: AAA family ATPase [Nitrososphaerales archaeon]|nr:AAA family ATPase [Nitrososphaerales archaeon]
MSGPFEELSTEQERTFSPPIKEIILENFMSYEYARIPLNQGLNLIVGPNGAGKSSILLAISVAFGQAYTERSRKLSDLIRRGKDIARVSLIFDNKVRDGRRPIPYSKADTFMLSRYLRKDGSYWYEADYKEIDKSEVVRLLREFGINPDNLLIIMHQGMIEELGAISQEQRLVMVEEAVGFREYRQRILAAEADLKGMVSEEGSLVQLIDNANQTIEYWKQIYDRFLEKKRLQEHRTLLERELLWAQEGRLSRSLSSIRERLEAKRESLADLREQQKKAGSEAEGHRTALGERQVEVSKLYGALIRAERERAGREATRDAMKGLREELETLSSDLGELVGSLDAKRSKRVKEFIEFASKKSGGDSEEAGRKKTELDREVASLQAEVGSVEDAIRKVTDDYIAQRVRFEVLEYRTKVTESEIRELERSERDVRGELDAMKPDLDRAGERIITQRAPYEVSEELKLVSAQLQKLQDLPDDAEKIYKDYTGNLEGLKGKLQELQDNKKLMLNELEERKKAWRNAVQNLIDEVAPTYQQILSTVGATGAIRLDVGDSVAEAGLQLLVGFKGAEPSILDPYTQSGGERSVALVAFMLSLQSRIISPLRAMDEFDIHMDPRNREAIFKMILAQGKRNPNSQNIVITPSIITVADRTAHVITVQSVHGSSQVKEYSNSGR